MPNTGPDPSSLGPVGGDAVTIVRSMLAAQVAGRVDDAIACTHVDVVVRPAFRPGFTVYRGHDGLRQMLELSGRSVGTHRVAWSDPVDVGDGLVTATAVIFRTDPDGSEAVLGRTRAEILVRDGLVAEFDSFPDD